MLFRESETIETKEVVVDDIKQEIKTEWKSKEHKLHDFKIIGTMPGNRLEKTSWLFLVREQICIHDLDHYDPPLTLSS